MFTYYHHQLDTQIIQRSTFLSCFDVEEEFQERTCHEPTKKMFMGRLLI